jgi:hypothetical protein
MSKKEEFVLSEREIAEIQEYLKEQIKKFGIHVKMEEEVVIIYLYNIISLEFVFTKVDITKNEYKPSFTIVVNADGIRYFVFFNVERENGKLLVEAVNYSIFS